MSTSKIGLSLNPKTKERLEALGKARDRSPHYLMNVAIERYLDKEEAVETERQLVNARWVRFEVTGEVLDHADITPWASKLATSRSSDIAT